MTPSPKLFIFAALLAIASTATFPSYIKKCKKGAELNECVLLNGQAALQHILKGDEDLGIPCFDPYVHAEPITFGSKEGLCFELSNLYYTPDLQLTEATWDVENRKAFFKLDYNCSSSHFDYKLSGSFAGHELIGEGHGCITSSDAWLSFDVTYGTETINGTAYPKIENIAVDYNVGSVVFDLKNLTDKDNCTETEMNELLSSNWKAFNAAISHDSKKFKAHICKTILNAVFKTVPIDELFD